MSWFVRRAGKSFGPYPFSDLQAMAARGQLSPVDELLQQGGTAWMQAGNVAGLFSSAPPSLAPASPGRPVVVEQTSKRWKLLQLVGVVLLIGGCTTFIAAERGTPAAPKAPPAGAIAAMFFGVLTYVGARFFAWWNHG